MKSSCEQKLVSVVDGAESFFEDLDDKQKAAVAVSCFTVMLVLVTFVAKKMGDRRRAARFKGYCCVNKCCTGKSGLNSRVAGENSTEDADGK